MNNFRVVFSPNNRHFVFEVPSFEKAVEVAEAITEFDLKDNFLSPNGLQMNAVAKYKKFRQQYNMNHSSLIAFSTISIDEKAENGKWYIISEDGQTKSYEVEDEIYSFDTE